MSERCKDAVVIAIIVGVSFFATACPRPLPPPPPPTYGEGGACPDQPSPLTSDVCAGQFTQDRAPCARCQNCGCVDARVGVYCVKGSCTDPRCGAPGVGRAAR